MSDLNQSFQMGKMGNLKNAEHYEGSQKNQEHYEGPKINLETFWLWGLRRVQNKSGTFYKPERIM